jgi:large subunit ribosomal protein L22
MAPRKVRLVADLIRGCTVDGAVNQLSFCDKVAAEPLTKLLKSAVANAEHNHQADVSTLRVAKITVDGGPTLSRWRARAYGRAAPIRKRTSHITLVLSDESVVDVHAPRARRAAATKSAPASAKSPKKASGVKKAKAN